MQSILLLNPDDRPFEMAAIRHVFESEPGFQDIRYDEPGGALIEADYIEFEDSTIVGLSRSRQSIWLSGTTDAALRAALVLQKRLGTPLRLIDSDYSLDLLLEGVSNVEQLRAAFENARTN
jgi:hypothetical protein